MATGGKKRTLDAKWSSSDPSIVRVTDAGIASALKAGVVTIAASVYGQDSAVRAAVATTLVGRVHESPPTQSTPVSGAVVTVTDGADAGATATSDASGRFQLDLVAPESTLKIARDGYDTVRVSIPPLDAAPTVDVGLIPNGPEVYQAFTGILCADPPFETRPSHLRRKTCIGNNYPYPVEMRHAMIVHRPGRLFLGLEFVYRGDYYANYLTTSVWCGTRLVAAHTAEGVSGFPFYNVADSWTVDLTEPCAYDVRLSDYIYDDKDQTPWTSYQLEVQHPR